MNLSATSVGLATLLVLASGCASLPEPTCPRDPRVSPVAADWREGRAQQKTGIALRDAVCFRKHLMRELAPQLGPVVGYKVGIYTQAAQRNFGTNRPAIGVLHRGMLVRAGKPVALRSAFAPVAEADFVLVVKDDGINRARTREEAFRHLRGDRPFIDIPDNHFPAGTKVTAGELVALNVNARMGVLGEEVALPQTAEALAGLTNLSAELAVEGPFGPKRGEGRAVNTLADPLEIVLFARDALAREGGRLKAGDLISLGTLMPPHAPRPGETIRVRYRVLAQPSEISVSFAE